MYKYLGAIFGCFAVIYHAKLIKFKCKFDTSIGILECCTGIQVTLIIYCLYDANYHGLHDYSVAHRICLKYDIILLVPLAC